jgi:site-specific DNA-methyltransferase (adenine-specific)
MTAYYYEHAGITIYHGDCREILPSLPAGDCVIADPPYGQTSLAWDCWPDDWPLKVRARSLWVFGTLRMFMAQGNEFVDADFSMSQDIVWEKHNGGSVHADRFRRVHEHAVHFYRGPWSEVYKSVPMTNDATKRAVRRKQRPSHMGSIGEGVFRSEDGGPRLMRSVIYEPSCHGFAENETQKPLGVIRPLIEYSCAPGGLVIAPFCGSGSDLVTAKEMGRMAIGIDTREEQCEIAARRLSQEILSFPAEDKAVPS